MQLVGRQKFEKKGANPGGGGGPDLGLRSVFKFVSYWNPSVVVDRDGKARIQFQAPDNLTGWRVLAMAVTPGDRMGLGEGAFKVSQPTEIRPVLPNQVLEGDSFEAGFSLMNRTDTARTLEVNFHAEGPILSETGAQGTDVVKTVVLQPYERSTLRFPAQDHGAGEITFIVRAGDEHDRDAVKQTLPVQAPTVAGDRGVLRHQYSGRNDRGGSVSGSHPRWCRQPPSDDITDPDSLLGPGFHLHAELPVSLLGTDPVQSGSGSHFSTAEAVFSSIRQLGGEPARPITKALALAAEHQAPNGGMVYYIPKDQYADPYLSAYTALVFNWLRQDGFKVPSTG